MSNYIYKFISLFSLLFTFNPEISLSKKDKCVGVFVQVLRDVIRDNQANMIANQELKKLR
jgi:hypothetical protein